MYKLQIMTHKLTVLPSCASITGMHQNSNAN